VVEAAGGVKEKEPPLWKWEKQDLERQIMELKKKIEDSPAVDTKKTKTKKVRRLNIFSVICNLYKYIYIYCRVFRPLYLYPSSSTYGAPTVKRKRGLRVNLRGRLDRGL